LGSCLGCCEEQAPCPQEADRSANFGNRLTLGRARVGLGDSEGMGLINENQYLSAFCAPVIALISWFIENFDKFFSRYSSLPYDQQ
jgi:hypothetical protein